MPLIKLNQNDDLPNRNNDTCLVMVQTNKKGKEFAARKLHTPTAETTTQSSVMANRASARGGPTRKACRTSLSTLSGHRRAPKQQKQHPKQQPVPRNTTTRTLKYAMAASASAAANSTHHTKLVLRSRHRHSPLPWENCEQPRRLVGLKWKLMSRPVSR